MSSLAAADDGTAITWPHLPHLQSLDLSRNSLQVIPHKLWQSLPALQALNLSTCNITSFYDVLPGGSSPHACCSDGMAGC